MQWCKGALGHDLPRGRGASEESLASLSRTTALSHSWSVRTSRSFGPGVDRYREEGQRTLDDLDSYFFVRGASTEAPGRISSAAMWK